jgi:glycosyltransferase involved in cell wall biosynthesis
MSGTTSAPSCAAVHTVASIAERTGGPARTVTSLCSALGRAGAQVALVAASERADGEAIVRPDPAVVALHRVDVRHAGPFRVFAGFGRAVDEALHRAGPRAVVHDHGVWLGSNVAAWRAARRARVPYVLSPRGMLEPWALGFNAPRKRVAWLLYQRRIVTTAAALVATSTQECESIKRLSPASRVAIIPNGVELPAMGDGAFRDACEARATRERGGTVLFMSRVHPKKNILGLIDAWHRLAAADRLDGWLLRIAGPDEIGHRAEVLARIDRLGLADRVSVDGPIAERDKAAAFSGADVFVLPTFSENFGIAVAEALAYGVPVITTTGTPWVELPGRGCGWWVAPEPDTLALALGEAIGAGGVRRAEMGARGNAYVRERFSWQGVGGATLELYRWLLGQSSGKPDFLH